MSKHTPGPWTVCTFEVEQEGALYAGRWHIDQDGDKGRPDIAVVSCTNGAGAEQNAANARLIAAAPEMLEALISLMQPALQIEATKGGYCIFRFTPEQVAAALAAIAKAEGRS